VKLSCQAAAASALQPLDCVNPDALLGLPGKQQVIAAGCVTCAALPCSVYQAAIAQLESTDKQELQLVRWLMLPRVARQPHDIATLAGGWGSDV
jgi:hypothetical protein